MRRAKGRRESALEHWCKSWARLRGIIVSKQRDPTGIPDNVFWVPGGRPWVVEFKDQQDVDPSPLQWYHLILLRHYGYRTALVTTRTGFVILMQGDCNEPRT
jgi:hypothetical protein